MATISRLGYGVVEMNRTTFEYTGKLHAQLPVASGIAQLEEGQFVKYDKENGEVNFTGDGPWYVVYNDYAADAKPWLIGAHTWVTDNSDASNPASVWLALIEVGDWYTTNAVGGPNTAPGATYAGVPVVVGDELSPNASGWLVTSGGNTDIVFKATAITTLPDGQVAVELLRIE